MHLYMEYQFPVVERALEKHDRNGISQNFVGLGVGVNVGVDIFTIRMARLSDNMIRNYVQVPNHIEYYYYYYLAS